MSSSVLEPPRSASDSVIVTQSLSVSNVISQSSIAAPTSSTGNSPPSESSTPPVIPQSSPGQTSSPAANTTPASPTPIPSASASNSASASAPAPASASTSSTVAPTITTTSSFTTQVATTIATTNPGGSVIFITSSVPEVFTTSVAVTSGGGSPNNTGLIVGAVVGGVGGIVIFILLLLCIRRRRTDEFDGNFDPDRVIGNNDGVGGTFPNVSLVEEVTPFPQNQSFNDQTHPSMRQYGKLPYHPVPSSLGPSGDFYQPGTVGAGPPRIDTLPRKFVQPGGPPPPGAYVSPINAYGTGPADWDTPRPGVSPPPSTVSNNTSSTRVAKEREALQRSGQGAGQGLTAQHEVAEGSGGVVVHQDAGRAPVEEHVPPREIPPAYESIQRD